MLSPAPLRPLRPLRPAPRTLRMHLVEQSVTRLVPPRMAVAHAEGSRRSYARRPHPTTRLCPSRAHNGISPTRSRRSWRRPLRGRGRARPRLTPSPRPLVRCLPQLRSSPAEAAIGSGGCIATASSWPPRFVGPRLRVISHLFARIARHGISGDRDPREDRLTEICAALFESPHCRDLARQVAIAWLGQAETAESRPSTGSRTFPPTLRSKISSASASCGGGSSTTTASSKTRSASTTSKAAPTQAGTTTSPWCLSHTHS